MEPGRPQPRQAGKRQKIPRPERFSKDRQTERFGPEFARLEQVLARDPSGLELRADPTGLAPERLLVMEVRGAIRDFAKVVRDIDGLQLVDEEELEGDELDKAPVLYLLFPDVRALRELCSLWQRWSGRDGLGRGFAAWQDLSALLRDLRPWGPTDRLGATERDRIAEQIEGKGLDARTRLEIELVFRREPEASKAREEISRLVERSDGRVVDKARIEEIAYDALLVDLPVRAVRDLLDHDRVRDTIAWADPVMHIRPQATVDVVAPEPEAEEGPERAVAEPRPEPILALLDGVPVAKHRLLERHVIVEDLFDLEPRAPVAQRNHGTAMASLIVWGDLCRNEPPLPRKIFHVPVMIPEFDGKSELFPEDRLVVDIVYRAIRHLEEVHQLRDVLIVNLSLGNANLVFQGRLSPWARLLDRLAWHYGLLFVVSAGNHLARFAIPGCATWTMLQTMNGPDRAATVLRSIDAGKAFRRLLSPAESINALTVGAWNHDEIPATQRRATAYRLDPYPEIRMVNPSSALGPGFARAVKPDVVMPGGREHLRVRSGNSAETPEPAPATRYAGLKAAAPPDREGWTGATSAAAAQASRLAHRVHDVLEPTYGQAFLELPKRSRAVLLKAFVVHTAGWPEDGADLIERTVCHNDQHHTHKKANVSRYFGYGCVDPDRALACAEDRATFWAVGEIARETAVPISIPLPTVINAKALPHTLAVTLAWLAPVKPGTLRYRGVKLKLVDPRELEALAVGSHSTQPDHNQIARGTVLHRRWSGKKAPALEPDPWLELLVQREPDPLDLEPDPVPFALVATIEMPGVLGIYQEVRERLPVPVRTRV